MECAIMELAMESRSAVPGNFFMTVVLGTYPSVGDFRESFLLGGKKIGINADKIISQIVISQEKIEVDLWELCGADVGLQGPVPRIVLYDRFIEFGFMKCPPEAIALARINCGDNLKRLGAINPIMCADGESRLLNFNTDDGYPCLNANYDFPDRLWYPEDIWIVGRSRNP